MAGPYRSAPAAVEAVDTSDERLVAGVVAACGLIRVVATVLDHQAFGGEASLAILMLVWGTVGLVRAGRSARAGTAG